MLSCTRKSDHLHCNQSTTVETSVNLHKVTSRFTYCFARGKRPWNLLSHVIKVVRLDTPIQQTLKRLVFIK